MPVLADRSTMLSNASQTTFSILVVEDDQVLNKQLSTLMQDAGYAVESSFDGEEAILATTKQHFDLVLLDVMLPERDGISVLSMLRKTSQVPVIMVTAKGAEEERIKGLRQGADDYIAKPFNTTELLLRIEALLRRAHQAGRQHSQSVKVDNLMLDRQSQSVTIDDALLELTSTQFKILWQLGLHQGEVLSKAYLSQQALNRTLGTYDRGLDMHLSRIRRKLNQAGWQGDRLQTVHGEGYCLK